MRTLLSSLVPGTLLSLRLRGTKQEAIYNEYLSAMQSTTLQMGRHLYWIRGKKEGIRFKEKNQNNKLNQKIFR